MMISKLSWLRLVVVIYMNASESYHVSKKFRLTTHIFVLQKTFLKLDSLREQKIYQIKSYNLTMLLILKEKFNHRNLYVNYYVPEKP